MRPKSIVDRLEAVIGIDGAPVRLLTVIEAELITYFGASPLAAAETAERVLRSVVKMIADRNAVAEEAGLTPILVVIGSTLDTVAGSCHVLSADDELVARIKHHRLHVQALFRKMKGLTFAQFEIFGKRVLKELGAEKAHVTPHRGDQGIDFFGEFSFGQLQQLPSPFFKLAHDVRLLFAGQAKHYPENALGPNVVRELIGAVGLARTKTFSRDGIDLFQDLEIRPFSPVVSLLFTTGAITSGARRLAASAGIIAKDGEQLAVFLADRGVGMQREMENPVFVEDEFERWLAEAA